MEAVNVLVTSAIGDECLQRITSVGPRVKLTNVRDLFRAEQRGDLASKEKLDAMLAEAEVIFGRRLPQNVILKVPVLSIEQYRPRYWTRTPRCRFVHLLV